MKQGIRPEIGGQKVGFVPFKPPPKKETSGAEPLPLP